MMLKSFEVEPVVSQMLACGNIVEFEETGRNNLTIVLNCSDDECDELYMPYNSIKLIRPLEEGPKC